MDSFTNSLDNEVPDVSSYEDYEHLKAKQRASVLWLLSKAYNNDIPTDLRDPFYKDHDDIDRLKPQITQSLANAELYCLALANIYSDPNYHCLNHHGIMQILMRKGVYIVEPHDTSLTETVLIQNSPIKMSAHMVIIEGIMNLYIKEVLIPEKVAEVVNRYSVLEMPDELPEDPEEAALFWINKSCVKLKQIMQKDINEDETTRNEPSPSLPMLEELTDMSDGCCLAALLSFYCPDHLRWQEICLNENMSMADSIYNLQLVQFFCQEKLPYNICFLSLEDFLYLHETIQPNVLAFIADLLFLFEIRTAKCVRQPGVEYEEDITADNELIHNGSALCYPQLPTPAEMKAKSLQHSSWVDDRQQHEELKNGLTPIRSPRKSASSARLRQRSSSSHNLSDDDEELTRYFSALDIKADLESSPEILMIADRHKTPLKTGPKSMTSYSNNVRDYNNKDNNLDDYELHMTSSPNRQLENSNDENISNTKSSQLADYFTQLSQTNSSPSKKLTPNTTTFTKFNSENSKNLSLASNSEPAINIEYLQKSDKTSSNEQRSPTKSYSSRSIPHINKSDSVKQLLEENETNDNNINNSSNDNLLTDKSNSDNNEIASQVYNIRMKLEEKRKKIEMERKSAEEEWKSKRQNIGKEAFLRVVHKNGKEDDESDSNSKAKPLTNEENKGKVSLNDLTLDLDAVKRKWLEDKKPIQTSKPFILNESGDRLSSDDLKASIDLMESSITDIDADLERLQVHEQKLLLNQNKIPNNFDNSKFYLHSEQQNPPQPPVQGSQQFHLSAETQPQHPIIHQINLQQNMQPIHPSMISQPIPSSSIPAQEQQHIQRAIWSLDQVYNPNNLSQQLGPRRGQWGQPVMPVSTNSGNGINQWKTVPVQQQMDSNFQHSGYEPFDIHAQRQTANMPFSQAFHPMVSQNNYSYNMGGHYSSSNPQQSAYPLQNGSIPPQQQFNCPQQAYPQTQYGQNSNIGQYVQTQQFNPNINNSNINYNHIPNQMIANPEQNYHPLPINHYNSPQISHEKPHQMRPLETQTPTLMNSQQTSMPSVSIPAHYEEYDRQQVFSSPTNKPFIGRTFRVTKSKLLSPDISEHNSPTRSIISELSNEGLNNGKADSSSNSSTTTRDYSSAGDSNYPNESFFISFGNEPKHKIKPGLKPKQVKQQQQMRREQKSANLSGLNTSSQQNYSENTSAHMNETPPHQNPPQSPNSVSPGVGFVIGADFVNPDPESELEMAKRKESIMNHSLKRRAELEAKRLKKEQELALKREEERLRRENSEKKKEEEKIKRNFILEQYRQRKAAEEAEKNGSNFSGNSSTLSSKDSNRSNSTLVLNRPPRQRLFQTGKPRPKSLHVSATNIQDYSSLDCKPSRIMDDTDSSCQNMLSSNSNSCRPQSAMSTQSTNSTFSHSTVRRLPSPTQSHSSHVPSFPTGFMVSRIRGPPSDGASDAGSTFSEYTGPKLFVKPSQKSNKILILNAINVVLAGAVNSDTKKKVIEEINASDSKHYLILFRNAGLQFRALYSYNPDREEVFKLFGTGPKTVINEMIDRFYKYNSGSKSFAEIQTKHLSVTIDAFIIHNNLWTGKRVIPKKDYL